MLLIERDEVWLGVPLGSQTTGATVYKYNYKSGALYKDIRPDITTCWKATQSTATTWEGMLGTWNSQVARWNDGRLGSLSGQLHFGDTNGDTTIQVVGAEVCIS